MPFEPGQSGNVNGRPKGSKNRVNLELRDKISAFLEGEFETVKKEFAALSARDKLKFYTELLQYGLPKLSAVSSEIDIDKLSDEDVEALYNKIIEAANKD